MGYWSRGLAAIWLALILLLAACAQKSSAPSEGTEEFPTEAAAPPPDASAGAEAPPPDASAGVEALPPSPSEPAEALPPPPPPPPPPSPAPAPEEPSRNGEASATGPAPGMIAKSELPWCAIVEERLPPDECAALSSVARGAGAFKAPERMRRGDTSSVVLSISREAGSSAPSAAIAGAEGRERRFAPAVGRFLEAQLLPEPGLKVELDPKTPERQDLYASTEALWRWSVTAETSGQHQLMLITRVMARLPDGSFAPRGQPFTDTQRVEVYVEGADAIVEGAAEADKAFGAMSGTTESLTTLLTALAALVAAAGALWLAIRRFGKKPPADGG